MRKAAIFSCLAVSFGVAACATTENNVGVVVGVSTTAARDGETSARAAVTIERPSNPGLQITYVQPVDEPPLAVGDHVREYGQRVMRETDTKRAGATANISAQDWTALPGSTSKARLVSDASDPNKVYLEVRSNGRTQNNPADAGER